MTYHVSFGFILDYWRLARRPVHDAQLTGTASSLVSLLGFVLSLCAPRNRVIWRQLGLRPVLPVHRC
jgi:hypothetical protein